MGSLSSDVQQTNGNTLKAQGEVKPILKCKSVTAQNVQELFPGVGEYLGQHKQQSDLSDKTVLHGDEEQIRMMEDEYCIVLDENDTPIGSASKKYSHLVENLNKGLLHRAFSVFLFNSDNQLLLQQRASDKFTFKNMWTNTCCSHPLNVPDEAGVGAAAVEGAKVAAIRKLDHELGIKLTTAHLKEFKFLTRIHYAAFSEKILGETEWGEHEIDYILFIQVDVDHKANPGEAQDTKYVTMDQLKVMIKDKSLDFTPWFNLICKSHLYTWWDKLAKGDTVMTKKEQDEIMRPAEKTTVS